MQVDRAPGLGVVDASLLVVGSIVGAGIFLVSADVASLVRSPAVFYATWLLGGVVSLAGALSNGELGGMFPRSGGEYVYLREAYGPPLGFLSGWTSLLIVFPGSIASLAAGLGGTVAPMLGLGGAWGPKLVASAATIGLTVVNAYGLRPGKWTQNVLSGSKLIVFAGLLVLGVVMPRASGGPVEPFFAPGDRAGGVATALVPVLFAYSGWNAATYVAGEMRDPSRTLGRALALGTGMCVVLYLAINAAYLRAMPLAQLATAKEPARDALVALGGSAMGAVLSPLVAVCVLSSMQASVLVGPRIYHAMAEDGLFFQWIGRLSARTGVPTVGLVLQCAITLALVWVGAFDQLVRFTMSAIVAFSTLTVASVVVLRVRRPGAARAFRVPGYPLVPIVFVVVNVWMLWNVLTFQDSSPREALIGLGIVATGVPAYLWFARVARLAPRPRSRVEDA
jgi:APA family basic amino acid/polyamine antiporter